MSKARKNIGFIDEEDFTPIHDEIFIHLLENWEAITIDFLLRKYSFNPTEGPYVIWEPEFLGEPAMDGYPPVFPDAICRGVLRADHRGEPVEVEFGDYKPTSIHVSCEIKGQFGAKPRCSICGLEGEVYRPNRDETEDAFKSRLSTNLYLNIPCYYCSFNIIYEVKPEVKSYGKVLRQMNLYRDRHKGNALPNLVLITPTTKYDEPFEKQGVHVLHPEDMGLNLKTNGNGSPTLEAFTGQGKKKDS